MDVAIPADLVILLLVLVLPADVSRRPVVGRLLYLAVAVVLTVERRAVEG